MAERKDFGELCYIYGNRNLREELGWAACNTQSGYLSIRNAEYYRWLAYASYYEILGLCATVERLSRWTPVAERLPDFGTWCLCKCKASIYEVLKWTADGWKHDPNHIYMSGFVTHWMPLPAPPAEDKP